MLNTTLQRRSGIGLHLLTPASAHEQADLLTAGKADLVYANPFDATDMIRTRVTSRLRDRPNDTTRWSLPAAASRASPMSKTQAGCRIALTDNRDVKLIGLRLLETRRPDRSDDSMVPVDSHQAAARLAIKGEVEAAFFLADAFASLTRLSRSQLKVLVESAISDISHVVLAHPACGRKPACHRKGPARAGADSGDGDVLGCAGLPNGFEAMTQEEAEFKDRSHGYLAGLRAHDERCPGIRSGQRGVAVRQHARGACCATPTDVSAAFAHLHASLELPGAEPVQGALADLYVAFGEREQSLLRPPCKWHAIAAAARRTLVRSPGGRRVCRGSHRWRPAGVCWRVPGRYLDAGPTVQRR